VNGVATAWIAAVTAYFEPSRGCDSKDCFHAAAWWLDSHGCDELALCQRCLEDIHNWAKANVYVYGGLICKDCNTVFPSFEAAVKVRPI
jgi:hypothetical protein